MRRLEAVRVHQSLVHRFGEGRGRRRRRPSAVVQVRWMVGHRCRHRGARIPKFRWTVVASLLLLLLLLKGVVLGVGGCHGC